MNAKKKIIILGISGNCIDILDTINEINLSLKRDRYECIGFLDDKESSWGSELYGIKVLGPLSSAAEYKDSFFVNGIGSPHNFWRKREIIAATGVGPERFEKIIHPSANVSKMAEIGNGTVLFQNVTVTSNVNIGAHIVVLPNTVISHDDVIGDYSCVAGGVCVSGGVRVGHSCYLGTNSSITGNVTIGDFSLVGMGSVVLEDIPENSVYVGNPARFLRHTR